MRLASRRFWSSLLAVLGLLAVAGAVRAQQDEGDPPARVATVAARQGSVVFAPQGEDEWNELPANRPLTVGDRLWTDAGARAEVQLGSATVHVDSQSQLGIAALDERSAQFILLQGTVNARVRELAAGENFEIGTPNLAFRAAQAGDYRIDIDRERGETRVVVLQGLATVYGESGQSVNLGAGEQAAFAGRQLAQVASPPYGGDAFAQWAAERNRAEDLSVAARHVPRGVVGYSQLDPYGSWSQDPQYGQVWYPTLADAEWAPYRNGQWSWIAPWGWTWVDAAPWGFAPFHYGRWTMIGTRWAWVPGRLAPRPVYAPALVVFLDDAGSRVGWYPLAPGEAWWPAYRSSTRYLTRANGHIDLAAWPRHADNHLFRHRPWAMTAVRADDFRAGRSVRGHWEPVAPGSFRQAGVAPPRPERVQRIGAQPAPRLNVAPPANTRSELPSRFWAPGPRFVEEEPHRSRGDARPPQGQPRFVQGDPRVANERPRFAPGGSGPAQEEPRFGPGSSHRAQEQRGFVQGDPRSVQPAQRAPGWEPRNNDNAVREQWRAQREQQRLQLEAERAARQQRQQAEAARQQQERQNLVQRQQQDAARQAEALRRQHEANKQRLEAQQPPRQERDAREEWRGRGNRS